MIRRRVTREQFDRWVEHDRKARKEAKRARRAALPLERAAQKLLGVPYAKVFDVVGDGQIRFFCGGHGGVRTVRLEDLIACDDGN